MIGPRLLIAGAITLLLAPIVLHGQASGRYREFQLGGNLASVSAIAHVASSEAKTIRTRPALLQELEWRRPYGSGAASADPVQQIAFSFYDDQLFRMVIDYDRTRTDGMTDEDIVAAISNMYGPPLKATPATNGPGASRTEVESGSRVATWGDSAFTAALYRSAYMSSFRLIVTSTPLNAQARAADTEGAQLDEREAPERERARLQKEADDARAAAEKARAANKATFVP